MARPPRNERIEPALDKPNDSDEGAFDIRLGAEDRTAGGHYAPRAERSRPRQERSDPSFSDQRSEPGFGGQRSEPAFGAERAQPEFGKARVEPGFGAERGEPASDRQARSEPSFGRSAAEKTDDADWDDSDWDDLGWDQYEAESRNPKASAKTEPKAGAGERREPGKSLERTERRREQADPGPGPSAGRERREGDLGAADRRDRPGETGPLIDIEDAEFIDLGEDDPMAESRRSKPRRSKAPARKKARSGGRKRSSGGSGVGKWIRRGIKWTVILMFWGTIALAGGIAWYATQLPSTANWSVPKRPPNIKILANDGTLIANRGDTGGESVRLEELPPYLSQAVMAIEDRRFQSHFGIDPLGLLRAAYINFRSGDVVQGGSTVTQQLAKNLFLKPERTMDRKIQEAIMAIWLETKYSKAQIMESYLNRVYLGAGTYGVDAASRRYFGKSARDISLKEAAMLAGLLKAPSRYAPTSDPVAANSRANVVLGAMREAGFITAAQQKEAASITVKAQPEGEGGAGRYVADWVADLVPEVVGALDQDVIVETTIDPHLEESAGKALTEALDKSGKSFGVSQGALVAIDGTGAVRAMVGGRDYQKSQFNRAVEAKRQPGSAFKPFVYLSALEYGMVPETIRVDEPTRIGNWEPKNYEKMYKGPVSLQTALALSINTVAVQLANEVGPDRVIKTAERLGINSPLQPNPSIALGTSEVNLLELTDAYVPFANGGYGAKPHVIATVKNVAGKTLYEHPATKATQIIDPLYVGMMNSMMTDTLQRGTGRKAAIAGWQAAGKTGTTNDSRDAWFIGYTANLTTGVWLGNDDSKPTKRMTGGSLPAQIWNRFMTEAHKGVAVAALPGNYAYRDPAETAQELYQNGQYVGPEQGGLVDEYGQVVGSGPPPSQQQQQPTYQGQQQPSYEGQQQGQPGGQQQPQYRDQQASQPDYGGYNDPEAADGSWSDGGDYQNPPPGARIYREGDPSYGAERGAPVPPAAVGEDGQAGVYQARPHRRNLLDRLFGG
ncbi:PBP1A family penicillin-binding protein [Kaistia nematophila]|uniref:PBP1A family penicillin-binding protein n=1 Tax=Kaistia nematophila TaxID=2994654 RepID=A0A9X3E130_9HYPH|nr:PBP1A family penicillin-binding protein [Kaistia nematophila]MCX5567793.1 PBP1A family penicillin-binding protein [Kaistia nematophila]